MKRLLIITVAACCFASSSWAEVYRAPLYKLAPETSIDLRCIFGQAEIAVPIPERWSVTKAVLKLDYVNSRSILSDRSQLIVKLNGTPLGQTRLNWKSTSGRMVLAVPAELLKPGYNTLLIQAVQHYADECEQVCAPNLWTTLNLYDSSLEIEYDLAPVPLRLSSLHDFLFDPRIMPQGNVHVITPALTSDSATMAGIVASGIARKFDYRKVLFTVSQEVKPGMDNILIGDAPFAAAFLKQRGVELAVPGPLLKIMHLPLDGQTADPLHALIVVTGKSAAEIKLAAETLAHMNLPYPGSDEMIVKEFRLPDISRYSGRHILTTDKLYTLKTLNLDTHTFIGFNPNPRRFSFRLPADFLVKPNQYARLNLNLTYGAGMRPDSVLNIVVNDQSVRVIHLKNPDGENIEGYRIDLPTYLFKPGYNTVRFEATLNPVARECDILRPEGFFLTIFDNSTFLFPAMPHFVEMPKLELFLLDGFPITRWPDGYESTIYATRNDADTTAAALNLVGLISQKNGYPLFGTTIRFERPDRWKGEMIVLGDVASIPEDLLELSPLKLGKTKTVPYPVIRDWESETTFAFSGQASSLGPDRGIIMEFESPVETGRSIVVLTGTGIAEVSALSKALLEPGVQDRIKGDLVLLDLKDPSARISAVSAGRSYFTGTSGSLFKLEYYFYKYAFLNYILLLLGILAGGGILYYWLIQRRKKRERSKNASQAH